MSVVGGLGGKGGKGDWRSREIHLTERKTITALLLNDSPKRLRQRSKSLGDARPPDEHFGCPNY